MKSLLFLILFVYYVKANNLKNYNTFIFCEHFRTNCSKVIQLYGTYKCDDLLDNMRYASKLENKSIVITKKGLEIILLFNSDLCTNLNILTKDNFYYIYKYNINNYFQDSNKIVENNWDSISIQIDINSLTNLFDLKKINGKKRLKYGINFKILHALNNSSVINTFNWINFYFLFIYLVIVMNKYYCFM